MKILQINTQAGWGSDEAQTLSCIRGLRDLGATVEILARRGSELSRKATALAIRVREPDNPLLALTYLSRHGSLYDILHAHDDWGHTLAALSKPWHRRPVVWTGRAESPPQGWFASWKFKRTDAVVARSHAAAALLGDLSGSPVQVIPDVLEQRGVGSGPAADPSAGSWGLMDGRELSAILGAVGSEWKAYHGIESAGRKHLALYESLLTQG
jgi:hypothetical protein